MEPWDVDQRTTRRSCVSARSGWSREVRPDYPSDWPAIVAVASRLGIGSAETLRKWYRQAEVETGQRPGVSQRGVRGAAQAPGGGPGAAAGQ